MRFAWRTRERRTQAWIAWRLLRRRIRLLEERDGKDRWYGTALTAASRSTPFRSRIHAGIDLWRAAR